MALSTPQAATLLQQGQVVAIPTETVYGLAANATNPAAIAQIYALKGRPSHNPLISHVVSLQEAEKHGVFNQIARKLAQLFWPGPLTLVVPFNPASGICADARAGLPSVALRVPSHPTAQALLRELPFPLAAPSANRSGHVSATRPEHIVADFGDTLPILGEGPSPLGIESTVISCLPNSPPTLLRPGPLLAEEIERALGQPLAHSHASQPATLHSPGQLASHYAPKAPVRLNITQLHAGEALLAFGPSLPSGHSAQMPTQNLSPTANLLEAAQNLYSMLRALDGHTPKAIAIMPLYGQPAGMLQTLHNRLTRAATPK